MQSYARIFVFIKDGNPDVMDIRECPAASDDGCITAAYIAKTTLPGIFILCDIENI